MITKDFVAHLICKLQRRIVGFVFSFKLQSKIDVYDQVPAVSLCQCLQNISTYSHKAATSCLLTGMEAPVRNLPWNHLQTQDFA
ncbi:hypothetical protein L6452_44036 [Arctium lappa]|uniref:Uncharacterized protein n=1 Tax=Arctium lappa TaxID=4217 RepID=A0ACB8XGE3_ARCLA|nr:hypothetical protein L6452_44036 [Arctium lappa]